MVVDISSQASYPASHLSNFHPYIFSVDGVQCHSMEGFLQSLKCNNPEVQRTVCLMVGRQAKARGRSKNRSWRKTQTLNWRGQEIKRDSPQYQELLNRAFMALYENPKFRRALAATKGATLTHSLGKKKMRDTVLTSAEFCKRLTMLRDSGTLTTAVADRDKEVRED